MKTVLEDEILIEDLESARNNYIGHTNLQEFEIREKLQVLFFIVFEQYCGFSVSTN